MSAFAEIKKEKVFEFYPYFPPEVQMMVIDEMQPDDRCRFTRCSKLCGKQAKSSKNYIYGLEIHDMWANFFDVKVEYIDPDITTLCGFVLRYEQDLHDTKVIITYLNGEGEKLWREELCLSNNWINLAKEKFKLLLNTYQKTIRKVSICGFLFSRTWIKFDLGITSLPNVKSLTIQENVGMKHFFAHLQHPLDNLQIIGDATNVFNLYSEKIYQVREKLFLRVIGISKEQFLRLSASDIEMTDGDLSENDIFEIITSWQNGKLDKQIKSYAWSRIEPSFDVRKFVHFFGMELSSNDPKLEITHNKDDTKIAVIEYDRSRILFYMKS